MINLNQNKSYFQDILTTMGKSHGGFCSLGLFKIGNVIAIFKTLIGINLFFSTNFFRLVCKVLSATKQSLITDILFKINIFTCKILTKKQFNQINKNLAILTKAQKGGFCGV